MSQFRIIETDQTSHAEQKSSSQYVGMRLGNEEYILDITSVREILMLDAITYVPRVADHFEGVINLRGEIVPVINLRVRLGMKDIGFTPGTRIIVAEMAGKAAGFLVDAVTRVLQLHDENIEPPSSGLGDISEEYIKGIGRTDSGIVGWLDVEKLVA